MAVSCRLLLSLLFACIACGRAATINLWIADGSCSASSSLLVPAIVPGTCKNWALSWLGLSIPVSLRLRCNETSATSDWQLDGWYQQDCGNHDEGVEFISRSLVHGTADECFGWRVTIPLYSVNFLVSVRTNCAPDSGILPTPPIVAPPLPIAQTQQPGSTGHVSWNCRDVGDCCTWSTCERVHGSPINRSVCYLRAPYAGLCPACPDTLHYRNGSCSASLPSPGQHPSINAVPPLMRFASASLAVEDEVPKPSLHVCAPDAPRADNINPLSVDPLLTVGVRWTSANLFMPSSVNVSLHCFSAATSWGDALTLASGTEFVLGRNLPNQGTFDWTPVTSAELNDWLFPRRADLSHFWCLLAVSTVSDGRTAVARGVSGRIQFSTWPMWNVSMTRFRPYPASTWRKANKLSIYPGTAGVTFNLMFKGVRCRYLYTPQDLGIANGQSILLGGVTVYLTQGLHRSLFDFRVAFRTTPDESISDRFFTQPAKQLVFLRELAPSAFSARQGSVKGVRLQFDHPVKVTFPDSLVLEFAHAVHNQGGPCSAALAEFCGFNYTAESNIYFVDTDTPRYVCAASNAWSPGDAFPYSVSNANQRTPDVQTAAADFDVIQRVEEKPSSVCGAAPSVPPLEFDYDWIRLAGTGGSKDCVDPFLPACRAGASVVTFNGLLVLFGGVGQVRRRLAAFNDVWVMCLSCNSSDTGVRNLGRLLARTDCSQLHDRPTCRAYHTATRVGTSMVVVGGRGVNGDVVAHDDMVWTLDLELLEAAFHIGNDIERLRTLVDGLYNASQLSTEGNTSAAGASPTPAPTGASTPELATVQERFLQLLWRRMPNAARVRPTYRHATAAVGDVLYVFGGAGPHPSLANKVAYSDQLLRYDLRANSWADLTYRPFCCVSGLDCYVNSLSLCTGGAHPLSFLGCYSRHCSAGHSMVAFNNSLFVFGGGRTQGQEQIPTNALLMFRLDEQRLYQFGNVLSPQLAIAPVVVQSGNCDDPWRPPCRQYHAAALADSNGLLMVMGGDTQRDETSSANDVWLLELNRLSTSQISWQYLTLTTCDDSAGSPPCVSDHVLVSWVDDRTANLTLSDVNATHADANSSAMVSANVSTPLPIRGVLLFGGLSVSPGGSQYFNNIWAFAFRPTLLPQQPILYQGGAQRITVVGVNFGSRSDALRVSVGGQPCTDVLIEATRTAVSCVVPYAEGKEAAVVVTRDLNPKGPLHVYLASAPANLVEYPLPIVDSIELDGSDYPPWGGNAITVKGQFFGAGASAAPEVRLGGVPCRSTTWVSSTTLICVSPRGFGTQQVTVVVGGQHSSTLASPVVSFSYNAPEVLTHVAKSYPTRGGVQLTVGGRFFSTTLGVQQAGSELASVSVSVDVGSQPCRNVIVQTSQLLSCVLPPGIGVHRVTVRTGGLPSLSNHPKSMLRYAQPQVLGLAYLEQPPTAGGTFLYVACANCVPGNQSLSQLPASALLHPLSSTVPVLGVSVLLNGMPCTETALTALSPPRWLLLQWNRFVADTAVLRCVTPPGTGTTVAVTVDAGGQLSVAMVAGAVSNATFFELNGTSAVPVPPSSTSSNFAYEIPSVISVNPSPAFVDQSVRLQIRGTNLGAAEDSVTVLVGDSVCRDVLLLIPHSLLSCTLPAVNKRQRTSLVVAVRGQVSQPFDYFIDMPPVPHSLVLTMRTIAGIFLVIPVLLLVLLFVLREHPAIKAMSVMFSNIITVGGGMAMVAVFFLDEHEHPFCFFSVWILSIGFTLTCGSLVLKNYRLWKIFSSSDLNEDTTQRYSDVRLLCVLGCALALDVILLSAYTSLASCNIRALANPRSLPVLVLLGLYKFTVLIAALVIAVKSRIIRVKRFQERIQIGYAIYSISFAALLGVPVVGAMSENEVAARYLLLSLIFILVPALALTVLFAPRMLGALRDTLGATNPIVALLWAAPSPSHHRGESIHSTPAVARAVSPRLARNVSSPLGGSHSGSNFKAKSISYSSVVGSAGTIELIDRGNADGDDNGADVILPEDSSTVDDVSAHTDSGKARRASVNYLPSL